MCVLDGELIKLFYVNGELSNELKSTFYLLFILYVNDSTEIIDFLHESVLNV